MKKSMNNRHHRNQPWRLNDVGGATTSSGITLPDFLTVRQLADRWNVSRPTLRRWIVQGRLPAFQLPGGGCARRTCTRSSTRGTHRRLTRWSMVSM